MANATLSHEDVTADKHRKAAKRAEAQKALSADFGPPVAASALPPCPAPSPVAPEGVVKPRRLADVSEGLSAECVTADGVYNDRVAAWMADSEKLEGLKAFAYSAPESVTVETLRGRRDAIHAAELSLAQNAVTLCRDYSNRIEARAPELKVYAETCREQLAETEKTVVVRLNTAGVSVESQPSYPTNGEAAAITFSHQVRASAEWKAANVKLSEATNQHEAAVASIRAGKEQTAKAEAYLASVVKRLAAV